MAKYLRVEMPDGSKWDVPVENIARDYAKLYENDQNKYERALRSNDFLIDWAANNMNWEDVVADAVQHEGPSDVDYQEGWVNGEKEIVER